MKDHLSDALPIKLISYFGLPNINIKTHLDILFSIRVINK